MSLILSTTPVTLVLWRTNSLARVILVASILIFSNTFMEYATSGLENPLAYLFVALIFTLALNPKPTTTWAIASGGSVAGTSAPT
jgi:hypothetical protein